MGHVEQKIVGKDGVIRGYKIRTSSGYLVDRPVQLIADLEIWKYPRERLSINLPLDIQLTCLSYEINKQPLNRGLHLHILNDAHDVHVALI